MSPKLTYHIRMPEPHTHNFEVELILENATDAFTDVGMNVWTPGSYMVREYAKNVEKMVAGNGGDENFIIEKINKNTWRILNNGKDIYLHYRVYAFEETVRTCFLDEDHAAIIPAGLFIYPDKYDVPVTLHFHPFSNWKEISTSLNMVGNNKWIRTAPNLDILIDSPVEIGNQTIIKFNAAKVEHELAIYGEGNYDIEKIKNDIIKIVDQEVKVFGNHPCMDDNFSNGKYVFILHNSNSVRGGLEHLYSTSLISKRLNYVPENNYNEFISLVSHEYFHLWNVKRLRPVALGPFKYTAENYTTSLWIAEGFTNYYDDLILRRAEILTEKDYLLIAEKNINDTENAPGKAVHPVAHASFDAWIKYYRQNENSNNSQVNYYTRGGVLAMLLDILIIHNSNGHFSLDNVMRDAYEKFYLLAGKQHHGYTEEEFKTILEKFSSTDLDQFYADHVFGVKEINYAYYFDLIGIELKNLNIDTAEIDLGLSVNEKNMITQIRKNSSGEKGKLNVNDEIIAVNNFRYTPALMDSLLLNKKPGEPLSILVTRNGLIKKFNVELQNSDKVNYKLIIKKDKSELQEKLYRKWLGINDK